MDADLATGSDGTDPASVKEQKMSESIAEIKKQLQDMDTENEIVVL